MGSISKMTMGEANPAIAVSSCHFLDKLPVEVRLVIYKFAFQGSNVSARFPKNAKSPSIQNPAVVLRHSKHFGLLLGCHKIYNESLATYWSEAVLRLVCPSMTFNKLSEFRPVKLKLDRYAHRLCLSLPEAVKANVRHVRGMVLPALEGAFVEENPTLTASALLARFPKLATCEMTPTLAHPVDGIVVHTRDPNNEHFSQFKMMSGQDSTGFLAERYGVDATAGVAFLFKGMVRYYYVTAEDGKALSSHCSKPNPVC